MSPAHGKTSLLALDARAVVATFLQVPPSDLQVSWLGEGTDNVAFSAGLLPSGFGEQFAVLVSKAPTRATPSEQLSETALLGWGGFLGLTPILYAHGLTGQGRRFLIEGLIPGGTLSNEDFRSSDTQSEVISLLKTLHTDGPATPFAVTAADQLAEIVERIRNVDSKDLTTRLQQERTRFLDFVVNTAPRMKRFTDRLGFTLVHHDVKPENVMRRRGQLVLIDAKPASLGWAFGDVATAGLYFAKKGHVEEGLAIAAELYGIKPRSESRFYAVGYYKFARRAGFVLESLLAPKLPTETEYQRIQHAVRDAEVAFRLTTAKGAAKQAPAVARRT